jgi:protein-tyrosine kinase
MSAIIKTLHGENGQDIENKMNLMPMNNISDLENIDALKIGEALIARAKLKPADIEKVLSLQKEKNILFGEAANQLGLISKDDIESVLAQQFNYPYVREASSNISKQLLAAHMPFSAEVEGLRSLRGQLMMRWFNQGKKTLAVTSANGHENGHLVAANLAIVFSQLDKITLLIDANLRQPNQHRLFGIDSKLGLTNILGNQQGSYELTRPKSLPNLAVLTAGTEVPNPQELLSLASFSGILEDLKKIYDIILIDTTPLSLASDLLSVVSISEAAIIVAKKGVSQAGEVQTLLKQLNTTGTNVLGSVFQEF